MLEGGEDASCSTRTRSLPALLGRSHSYPVITAIDAIDYDLTWVFADDNEHVGRRKCLNREQRMSSYGRPLPSVFQTWSIWLLNVPVIMGTGASTALGVEG